MAEIRFENVSLRYKKATALQEVNLTLKENTICGLLGRNGAGKTSMMSLIASYLPASEGQVLYNGMPVFDNPEVMPYVSFTYSVGEDDDETKVDAHLKRAALLRPHWDEAYARDLLAQAAIPEKKKMSALSQGMRATVRGIIGLASRCPVTLYDEAYFGMDAAVRTWFIQEILEDYLRHPRTILFSTHFINEVENMLGEVIVLSQGKVLMHESCDELRAKGTTITGDRTQVDTIIESSGVKPLATRTLGSQKEAVLYGELAADIKDRAIQSGLTLAHPSLQDLFVHITSNDVEMTNENRR